MFDPGIHHVINENAAVCTDVVLGSGNVSISRFKSLYEGHVIVGLADDRGDHKIGDVLPDAEGWSPDVLLAFSNAESLQFLINTLKKQLELFED